MKAHVLAANYAATLWKLDKATYTIESTLEGFPYRISFTITIVNARSTLEISCPVDSIDVLELATPYLLEVAFKDFANPPDEEDD